MNDIDFEKPTPSVRYESSEDRAKREWRLGFIVRCGLTLLFPASITIAWLLNH